MVANLLRRPVYFVVPFTIATLFSLFAQTTSAPTTLTPETKTHAFDVVSIKPSAPGAIANDNPAPTGYSAGNVTIYAVLKAAFFPRDGGGKLVGGPDWIRTQHFDIEAKVTVADLDELQKERLHLLRPLLQQLLQNMLADRFKLVAHLVPSEKIGYEVVVDKRGAKLTDAPSDGVRPDHGLPLAGGGYMVPFLGDGVPHVSFYGVTMAALAEYLPGMAAASVVDHTGLTGRYDFTLTRLPGPDEQHEWSIPSNDPDKLSYWNFGALGLKATQAKIPTEDLVIDHIEKPSEN